MDFFLTSIQDALQDLLTWDVNNDIKVYLNRDAKKKLADKAFVFMARATFKPSLTVIAHYFTQKVYQVCEFLYYTHCLYDIVLNIGNLLV